jgi:hypothetical protein
MLATLLVCWLVWWFHQNFRSLICASVGRTKQQIPKPRQCSTLAAIFMTTITSKRHILRFYLTVIFGTLSFLGMGSALVILFITSLNNGELTSKLYFGLVFSAGCYFMAGYTVYNYLRNSPIVKVDKEKIYFNQEIFYWKQLQNIELTGKKDFKYFGKYSCEATTIYFNSEQTKIIFDDMYSNAWEIKLFIQQNVLNENKTQQKISRLINPLEIESESLVVFKGNPFLSFEGVLFWGTFASAFCLIYFKLTNPNSHERALKALPFFVVILLTWLFLNSWFMHYFKISNTMLVIKNHNLLWIKKAYYISDIKEIVFETKYQWPNCLRVITNDFQSKLYPAGTLQDKTWYAMKEKFESFGISVRNECI